MKRQTILVLVALLGSVAAAQAQNPCSTPNALAIIAAAGTNHFYGELPEQAAALADGTPLVAAYQFAVWPEGADPNVAPPSQGPTTLPKTSWIAVPGASGCYELVGGLPGLIPTSARMAISLRAQAQAGAPEPFSPWSSLSNSFSLASVRVTPAVPGRMRVNP
jgi:hypothetical protein